MSKRLLILADPYGKPSFAPRLRYFCDYLSRQGWLLDVYTEQLQPIPFEHTYPIHEIPLYANNTDRIIKMGWSLLTDWKNRYFSQKVKQLVKGKHYDAVFCTTFSTFPLRAASEVAKEKALPLYIDIRDLDEQVPGAQYQSQRSWWARPFRNWYKNANIQRRNHVLKQADCITTISPWHVDFIRQFCPNVHLIYNGYDPRQFYPEDIKSDTFLVSYIGKIYEFQDPSPVEQAIREIGNPDIVLNYHTPTHSPLPIQEVGNEIRRSSIMIVLTSPDAKGMMTTKYFEAVGCQKPVLCVPDDNGLLAQTIRQTNTGVACNTVDEIKQFILEKYAEWKTQGFTRQAVYGTEQFSREAEAQQLEQLLLH